MPRARISIAGRTIGDNHDNSGLGIFCATLPHDYIHGFGPFFHELTIKAAPRVLKMSIGDFAKLSRASWQEGWGRNGFEERGRLLARDYDLVEIVEITGKVEQAIILRDDAIVSSRKLSQDQFSAIAIPRETTPPARPKP